MTTKVLKDLIFPTKQGQNDIKGNKDRWRGPPGEDAHVVEWLKLLIFHALNRLSTHHPGIFRVSQGPL